MGRSSKKHYNCKVYSKAFNTMKMLKIHEEHQHYGKKHLRWNFFDDPLTCPKCFATSETVDDLQRHIESHKSQDDLKPSRKSKRGRKVNQIAQKCNFCKRSFIYPINLQKHIEKIHPPSDKLICQHCGKVFPSRISLRRHSKIHIDSRPHKCDICGADFKLRGCWRAHIKTHMNDAKKFLCEVCSKSFIGKRDFKRHLETHLDPSQRKGIICQICGKKLLTKGIFTLHMRTHTGEKPCICKICGAGFRKPDHLNTHMRIHTQEKPYQCDLCGKKFSIKASLVFHKRIHTGERPYECEACKRGFVSSTLLKKHVEKCKEKIQKPLSIENELLILELEPREEITNCPKCGIAIKQKNLQEHINLHNLRNEFYCGECKTLLPSIEEVDKHNQKHGINMFSCKICPVSFDYFSKYYQHLIDHTLETRKKFCNLCLKLFSRAIDLRRHVDVRHKKPPILKIHSCTACGENFSSLAAVEQHFKTHTIDPSKNYKTFECAFCPAIFTEKRKFSNHINLHVTKPSYLCDMCAKPFFTKSELDVHLKRAHGKPHKPVTYVCEICENKFMTKWLLMVHIRKHTGERPCVCQLCGMAFRRMDHLKRHIMSHGNERPFVCSVCNKAFKLKTTLNLHMKTHTSVKPYQCQICLKRVMRLSTMKAHLEKCKAKTFGAMENSSSVFCYVQS